MGIHRMTRQVAITSENVRPPVARLLHRIARDWTPPMVGPRAVSRALWGDRDVSASVQKITPKGHDLELTGELAERASVGRQGPFAELVQQSISGETVDGWRFNTRQAIVVGWGFSDSVDGSGATVRISANDWSIVSKDPAVLWVSDVAGERPRGGGNLDLRSGRGFSRGHYRLAGSQYTYYLINSKRQGEERIVVGLDTRLRPSKP